MDLNEMRRRYREQKAQAIINKESVVNNNIVIDVFRQKYGKRFQRIISSGFAELDANLSYDDEEDTDTLDKTPIQTDYRYQSDAYHKVVSIIADKLGVDSSEISTSSTLSDLGADSLDAVELIMEFEKEFGISISDDDAERIKTIEDAVKYIEFNT